jgi:hypothetical protein
MSVGNDRAKDEAAIRALVENWAKAVRARDLDGVLRHHLADILMFDVPPPLASKGIDAYRKTGDGDARISLGSRYVIGAVRRGRSGPRRTGFRRTKEGDDDGKHLEQRDCSPLVHASGLLR